MLVPIPEFTAPSYGDRTLNQVQRMLNWYPEKTPEGYKLVSCSGFKVIGTVANGSPCAGAYFASTNQLFSLHGDTLYEISSGGAATSRGTITVTAPPGIFFFADNGTQLFLVIPGDNGYVLTMAAGTLAAITDTNYPSNSHGAAFLDSYFITTKIGTGQFYLSQLLSGTSWTPVQFATAEYAGDNLTNVKRLGNQLYLFGTRTIERWYSTGNPSFPLERLNGGTVDVGIGAAYSLDTIDESAYFIGSSQGGLNTVYSISNSGLQRISTPYIESLLQGTYTSSWIGHCYRVDGHSFYEMSNYTSGGAFAYCIDTGAWIERAAVGSIYNFRPIINAFSTAGQPPYAFSATNSSVYEVRPDYNSNAGAAISRIRIFGPVASNSKRVFHHQIRIELELKFDAAGSTSIAPTLDWTDDGGLTYSTARTLTKTVTSTTTGQRVIMTANRLGASAERYYRLTLSGPAAKIILKKCELDLEEGRT